MRRRLLTLAAALVAVTAAGLSLPAQAEETAEAANATPVVNSLIFGGVGSNISYSAIWDRGLPDRLLIDPDQSVRVTAFFAPSGTTDGVHAGTPVTYRWYYWCAEGKEYLTDPVEDFIPGIPGWSPVQGPTWPTLAVDATLTVPEHCKAKSLYPDDNIGRFNIEFRGTGSQYSASGPHVLNAPLTMPEFELDANGDVVLYSIVSEDEVQVIQETGNWLDTAGNTVRYFFTACEPAREFRDFLLGQGASLGGLATSSAPLQTLVEEGALAAVEETGGQDVAVSMNATKWALMSGPDLAQIFGDDPGSSMCGV
ncbi:hypothetical protein [Jiangella mangrovi]|uniref:Uncharacterized protein n=1 Tax=Jiangella mangrovi TaxID=1524084 RepID=A0A7W9GKV2_9ACTN|nr:hypothetical protein [Jiangella mangrovi]MBB5785551.1 hypothetical protein [Jiangella mangrovi]